MSEERESRRVWWVVGIVLLVLVALRFLPEVDNPLAPEPVAAHVAILAAGEAVARDGDHELAAGTPFRLFAVLEAKDWRGEMVWFSEAPALAIGGREIPARAHRRWPDSPLVKVLWFTLEGAPPYLRVTTDGDLTRFRMESNFHPEWGGGWTAEGVVDPHRVSLGSAPSLRPLSFGTQRYSVRIEFYDDVAALTPKKRAAGASAEAVLSKPWIGTRVRASLPTPLSELSRAFGRPEIDPQPGLSEAIRSRLDAWADQELVYLRAQLLTAHLAESGASAESLAWREIDLVGDTIAWGVGVAPGDLLQAGPRVVVLFRDQGEPGRLDPSDLVVDVWEGLRIRRIEEIFVGAGSLGLELAILPRRAD